MITGLLILGIYWTILGIFTGALKSKASDYVKGSDLIFVLGILLLTLSIYL